MKLRQGFTVVELLIVIVVIAILAAISIVSYRGIQSRAHDAAIRSDFNHIYNLLELYRIDNGTYPHDPVTKRSGGISPIIRDELQTIEMKLSTGSYDTTSEANTNLLYIASTDGQQFALLGYAKKNPTYYITDQQRVPKVYEADPNDASSRYPKGNPGGIANNLDMPYDIAPLYIYNKASNNSGFQAWD